MRDNLKNRVGEVNKNRFGSIMVIEEYISSNDILLRFVETGYLKKSSYTVFKKGDVKNPYDRSVYGVGFIGEGKYKVIENGKKSKPYEVWQAMLQRCYDEKWHIKNPTYKGITVDDEWHNYQVFGSWFENNYYEFNEERMNLDKDLIIKGNKIYSPETCVFVPQSINLLFIKRDKLRGNMPIGVIKNGNKYYACCSNNNESINLGSHDTVEKAFNTYKIYKEQIIKETAHEIKSLIPNNLYEALMNYVVELSD